jgi:polysaccharide biosynthesis/export protein
MRRNFFLPIFFFALSSTILGCSVSKQLPYFTDLPENKSVTSINTVPYEPLRLQANDEVQITITSTTPEAAQFFNLPSVSPSPLPGGLAGESQGYNNLYRISSTGKITMPVLDTLQAAGLTIEELKASIGGKLKNYLKDAVVTAKLTNFKVTVIGEVGKPLVIPVSGQTINVLEAVGAAGDLTVYGLRRNVRVIRKLPDGKTEIAVLNLNKSDVFKSPYFQLKQNDIVYIEPNRNKAVSGTKASVWIPIVTSLLYVGAIILSREL